MKVPIMTINQLSRVIRHRSLRWVVPTLIACSAFVVLCQAPTEHSQSFVDSDPALYRCAVLGETRLCRQQQLRPSEWSNEWVIPSERRESLSVTPARERAPNLYTDSGLPLL